jgi:hypothetical protein
MADAYKLLTTAGLQLGATLATIYTAPAATGVVVRRIVVINNDTVDRTFALYRGGGTTAPYLWTEPAVLVPKGGSVEYDICDALSPSEVIKGIASAASVLNIQMSGDETS